MDINIFAVAHGYVALYADRTYNKYIGRKSVIQKKNSEKLQKLKATAVVE